MSSADSGDRAKVVFPDVERNPAREFFNSFSFVVSIARPIERTDRLAALLVVTACLGSRSENPAISISTFLLVR